MGQSLGDVALQSASDGALLALVAISQQLGQAAVKSVSRRSNGGRQSAVGSQSAVSGEDSDDDDDGELRRRSFLRTAGPAAPAQCTDI